MSTAERNFRSTEAQIRGDLLRQLGLITVAQARSAGMSPSAVTRRVQSGRWRRVLPGVYCDALVPVTFEQSSLAALLWGGPTAFVSFQAAGALWALDGLGAQRVHLWTPRRLNSDLVVVHRGTIAPNDRRMIGPITVTSPARTLVDLAGVLDDEDLNAARLRAILEDRGNQRPTMSRLEVKIWRTLRAKGLSPVRQHPVKCGTTTYHLDCAFPQWRVSVEGFGDKFHRSPRNRRRELRRLGDLAAVHWRVLPVTWDEITDTPDAVVAKIVTTLAA
jgi:very-short-patch-repair endonuclease